MGGLIIEDLQEGFGKEAVKGKEITVHYTGWLENGTKFDSSLDRPRYAYTARQYIGYTEGGAEMQCGKSQGFKHHPLPNWTLTEE